MGNCEPAPLVIRYEPAITPEELWRHDMLERAHLTVQEDAFIAWLIGKGD